MSTKNNHISVYFMGEYHVFLLVIIHNFWELYIVSVSACYPQSCVCTCSGRSSAHHPKCLKPGYVIDWCWWCHCGTFPLRCDFYWPILISFTDDLPLCTQWLRHDLDDFVTFLPHCRLHTQFIHFVISLFLEERTLNWYRYSDVASLVAKDKLAYQLDYSRKIWLCVTELLCHMPTMSQIIRHCLFVQFL